MDATRFLIVMADDYGIGPETSRGILELAARGIVTGTVLMVNSPHAPEAVQQWRKSGARLEMGWHPCLTIDAPVAGADRVPSLVGPDGTMWALGKFLKRLMTGRVRAEDIERELSAQYDRFVELVGRAPTVVNIHQHVGVFPAIGLMLRQVLERERQRPYVRLRAGGPVCPDSRGREPAAVLTCSAAARPMACDGRDFPARIA